jgi:hypothetical protein
MQESATQLMKSRREPQNILVIKRREADKTNNKLHQRARNNPRDTTLVRLLNASISNAAKTPRGNEFSARALFIQPSLSSVALLFFGRERIKNDITSKLPQQLV